LALRAAMAAANGHEHMAGRTWFLWHNIGIHSLANFQKQGKGEPVL
jgi:hypothetical protein